MCAGNTLFIPRIPMTPTDAGLPFTLRRRQFPVRPAFAMSINKSQGQTLDKVGILLDEPVFAHCMSLRRGVDSDNTSAFASTAPVVLQT